MVRIGQLAPLIRVPVLMHGTLTYFDWERTRGHCIALCCVQSLGLIDAIFLNHQSTAFEQCNASLIALCREDTAIYHSGIKHLGPLRVPILSDPLRRLHRLYGIRVQQRLGRCVTFLVDADRILRFRVVHDLNRRGLSAVQELLSVMQHRISAIQKFKLEMAHALSRRSAPS